MKIGIIGAGAIGSTLASKFVTLGHSVSIANSRGPASLKKLAHDIGAEPATVEDVIKNKELIIVSIPEKSVTDLPTNLFSNLQKGVAVIDTGNYYPVLRDGIIRKLEKSGIDSLWVQQQLGIPVIKVFNSISAGSLRDKGRPKGEKGRIAIPVSGDDSKSKEIVFNLVDEIGFDYFDIGTIADSWKQQPGSSIYGADVGLEELKKRVRAMGSDWSAMRNTIIGKHHAEETQMANNHSV